MDGKAKTVNEAVYYAVDILHTAIQQQTTVAFQYIEYTPQKKKRYKHGGRVYVLSPYDMVWNSDAYYVCGYSESHGKADHLPGRPDVPPGAVGERFPAEAGGL